MHKKLMSLVGWGVLAVAVSAQTIQQQDIFVAGEGGVSHLPDPGNRAGAGWYVAGLL